MKPILPDPAGSGPPGPVEPVEQAEPAEPTGAFPAPPESGYDLAGGAIWAEAAVRLDQEGDPGTVAGLLAGFGGTRPWFEGELTFLENVTVLDEEDGQELAERNGSVRLYPDGLSTDEPVETKVGPFLVIVDGDLVTPDYIRFSTDDYVPGLIVVTGDLRAKALFFELGVRIVVEGSAVISQACLGRWGDANAMLDVHGELDTPVLALDGHTPVYAERGVRSVISDGLGWWEPLRPDILPGTDAEYFRRDVLDHDGLDLDFERAFAAACEGTPLLLPGAEESFPQRLEARPAVSGYQLE